MFSRISDALQTVADVLAPPATRFEDFEYHWKMIVNFYQNYDENAKIHVEDTRIPHHLHQMLQLIVDEEKEQQGGTVGACLEAVVNRKICLVDALPALAAADRPPGARALALNTATQLLRRTRQPCVNSASVFRPLQRMLLQCTEIPASPTEKEEVELLLTLCGLVRKDPGLANLFTTPFAEDKVCVEPPEDLQTLAPVRRSKYKPPKKNPLFEVELASNPLASVCIVRGAEGGGSSVSDSRSQGTTCEENDKFILIDLLLNYLNSADNQVVLRACEGIMIVSSLPADEIASLVASGSPACETIIGVLASKYRAVPASVDPAAVAHLNTTWAYVAHDFGDKTHKFHGYRELTSFFSWLDYCDTLMKECHPTIAAHLSRTFRQNFLEAAAETLVDPRRALLATALLAKCLKQADSPDLINEFSEWLVGAGETEASEWPLLHTLITHCLTDCHDLTLETLRFFESIIEAGASSCVERLVLARVARGGYLCGRAPPPDDERDRLNDLSTQRERSYNREVMKQLQHEEAVQTQVADILQHEGLKDDPDSIHRVINSFLLLLPRALLSDPVGADYEHYIHDAHRHYQLWLDVTSNCSWAQDPICFGSDNTASSTHSYDSRPEADCHLDDVFDKQSTTFDFTQRLVYRSKDIGSEDSDYEFDEGPFMRMLFKLLSNMPYQPYQVNLHLTSIISKLALLPHPALHEYLLNPFVPTAPNTRTLYKVLQDVARRLTAEIPRLRNYKTVIESTRLSLMSDDPAYDESGDHNQLVESLIVLEEFCKELAAIAFVKYQHSINMHR